MSTPRSARAAKRAPAAEEARKALRQQFFVDVYHSRLATNTRGVPLLTPEQEKQLDQLATEAAVRAVTAFDQNA